MNKSGLDKQILEMSRPHGKTNFALQTFLSEGMKGKSVVYATPEGNFLSPKAVAQAVQEALAKQKEELVERLSNITSGRRFEPETIGYNRAICEVIDLIKEEVEDGE